MENEEKKEVVKEIVREVPRKERRRKIKIPTFVWLIICIVVIIFLFGGSLIGIKSIFESQEKVLKLGLEDVGELVTQTCHTVVLEDSKESLSFFSLFDIPFTESRQIFSYDFDVDASLNFSKINIMEIDDSKKEIKVKIPHSKIYKVVILADSFRSYLDSDGVFSRIDLTEHNDALKRMETVAQNQCLAGNLLEKADENAEKLLSFMIKSEKKYKEYDIVFEYYDNEENNNVKNDSKIE